MVSLLNLAFSNEFNLATFVVGLLSLGGVIINIIVTANNNKKKRYTDLITHRRITTMQAMMDCSSCCIKSMYSIMTDDCNFNANLDDFIKNKSQLFYDTNYKSKPELELREALNLMEDMLINYTKNHNYLNDKQKEKIFDVIKVMTEYYQLVSCIYCKCEWERIKITSLSVKENYDTKKQYFAKKEEFKDILDSQRQFLLNNKYSDIIKDKD